PSVWGWVGGARETPAASSARWFFPPILLRYPGGSSKAPSDVIVIAARFRTASTNGPAENTWRDCSCVGRRGVHPRTPELHPATISASSAPQKAWESDPVSYRPSFAAAMRIPSHTGRRHGGLAPNPWGVCLGGSHGRAGSRNGCSVAASGLTA